MKQGCAVLAMQAASVNRCRRVNLPIKEGQVFLIYFLPLLSFPTRSGRVYIIRAGRQAQSKRCCCWHYHCCWHYRSSSCSTRSGNRTTN